MKLNQGRCFLLLLIERANVSLRSVNIGVPDHIGDGDGVYALLVKEGD